MIAISLPSTSRVKYADIIGGRTEDTIVSWVKKKSGPPAATIATKEDAEKLLKEKVAVIGYFAVSFLFPPYSCIHLFDLYIYIIYIFKPIPLHALQMYFILLLLCYCIAYQYR